MFGLGTKTAPVVKDQPKKAGKPAKPAAAASQSDEAKALLAKMEAKKEAGDCPFC